MSREPGELPKATLPARGQYQPDRGEGRRVEKGRCDGVNLPGCEDLVPAVPLLSQSVMNHS